MTSSDLERIEEIKMLKARYCRHFDNKNWDAFFALFTDDAIFDMRSAGSVGTDANATGASELQGYKVGRDAIAAHLAVVVADITTSVHHCHNPEITLMSPDSATGLWALDDWHQFHTGPLRTFHGFGQYEDLYAREDGRWLIKSTRLTRLRVDIEFAQGA